MGIGAWVKGLRERLLEVPVVGTVLRVQERFTADHADQHAAAIGFFAFLSLFPLLLLALSVIGAVMANDPAAQARLADRLLRAIPGFQAAFGEGDSTIRQAIAGVSENAGSLGLVGIGSLLFTGSKVVSSASRATLDILRVEVTVPAARQRIRQLGVLGGLGVVALVGVAATALVGSATTLATNEAASLANATIGGGRVVDGALLVVTTSIGTATSLVADFILFLLAYRWLSYGRGPGVSHLWHGALLGAVGWTSLKVFGATYITRQIARTNASIGALGGVVGLLLLLYLAGRVFVYGLELASILRRPGEDLAARYDVVHLRAAPPSAA